MKKVSLVLVLVMIVSIMQVSTINAATDKTINTGTEITDNLSEEYERDVFRVKTHAYGKFQIQFTFDYEGDYYVIMEEVEDDGDLKYVQQFEFGYSGTTSSGTVTQYSDSFRDKPIEYVFTVKKQLYGGYSDSDYRIKINFTEENGSFEKEPNQNGNGATSMDTNDPMVGNLSAKYDKDFYKVTLPTRGKLVTRLGYMNDGQYDIVTYAINSSGDLKWKKQDKYTNSGSGGFVTETGKEGWYDAGDYYFEISTYNSDFSNADYLFSVVSDVNTSNKPSSWAQDEVQLAINKGLIPENFQSSYTSNITREDFCKLVLTMLSTKAGTDVSSFVSSKGVSINYGTFKDTTDFYVVAANALGIVNGKGDGIFDPSGMITRQEAAIMLLRASKVIDSSIGSNYSIGFADKNLVASWAQEGIGFVTSRSDLTSGKSVMGGVGNNEFSPLTKYTREQSYLTIIRLFQSF